MPIIQSTGTTLECRDATAQELQELSASIGLALARPSKPGILVERTRQSQEALALSLIFRTDMTADQIASEVGVNRKTLYKWPAVALALKTRRDPSMLPRGTKHDGNVEAIDDS